MRAGNVVGRRRRARAAWLVGPGQAAGAEVDEHGDALFAQIWPSASIEAGSFIARRMTMQRRRRQRHRRHLLQFTVRFTVRVSGDADRGRVAGDLVPFEHRRVDGGEVCARVEDEDRSLGRDTVEVVAGEALLVGEVDRVEAADDDRFAEPACLVIESAQQIEQLVVGTDARRVAPSAR